MLLSERLIAGRGRPSGFDYLRLSLAVSVVAFHTVLVSYGWQIQSLLWTSPYRPIFGFLLPAFFSLSGFLVAGSLVRAPSLFSFLALRVFRIVPALMGDVLISALILGPLTTSVSLHQYFSGRQFWTYFMNIAGDIHFLLPGVFLHNPYPGAVNMQLWTIPFELECYAALAILALFRLHRHRALFLAIVLALQVVYLAVGIFRPFGEIDVPGDIPGHSLVMSFFAGAVLFFYRDKIRVNPAFAAIAACLGAGSFFTTLGPHLLAFPVAYVTVYLGTFNPRRITLLESGDYSYGIYLFGFPIQQTIAWLGPWTHHWMINLIFTAPVVSLAAFLSWHCLEKHALKLRAFIPVIENRSRMLFFGKSACAGISVAAREYGDA